MSHLQQRHKRITSKSALPEVGLHIANKLGIRHIDFENTPSRSVGLVLAFLRNSKYADFKNLRRLEFLMAFNNIPILNCKNVFAKDKLKQNPK